MPPGEETQEKVDTTSVCPMQPFCSDWQILKHAVVMSLLAVTVADCKDAMTTNAKANPQGAKQDAVFV